MKVSIVTISFNQAFFLERAMRSVLDQDYPDIEYIVVDPGSTDGSRDIIERYRDRIQRIVYEPDQGPADGLNKGFSHATGEIYGFLNADDELLPHALSRVVAFFETHPGIGLVSGCGYFIDSDERRIKRIVTTKMTQWLYVYGGVTLFQQGTFFRDAIFKQVGGFNIDNMTCWDGELFLDMVLAGVRSVTIGDDLALFRLHEAGITGSGRLEQAFRADVRRLFVKVMGRDRDRLDALRFVLARVAKGVVNPMYYPRRLLARATADIRHKKSG